MIWLRELFNPALKCARLGHRMIDRQRKVYLYPPEWSWNAVCDRAAEKWKRCRRCGHETEPEITGRTSLQGFSAPTEQWDRLRETGRLEA